MRLTDVEYEARTVTFVTYQGDTATVDFAENIIDMRIDMYFFPFGLPLQTEGLPKELEFRIKYKPEDGNASKDETMRVRKQVFCIAIH